MNPILFFDTETTGFPDWKSPSDAEHQPHLVQLAAILADQDTREVKGGLNLLIQPDGWEIEEEAAKVHGIDQDTAMRFGVPEKAAIQAFFELWRQCKRVAHNHTFDARIIRIASKRYLSDTLQGMWHDTSDYFCTMHATTGLCKLPSPRGSGYKWPKLAEAYKHCFGRDLDGAHNAMADTRACMMLYWYLQAVEAK